MIYIDAYYRPDHNTFLNLLRKEKVVNLGDNYNSILYYDNVTAFHKNGIRHRLDGPALIYKNMFKHYVNDELHNEHGPAIYWSNNEQEPQYILNGKMVYNVESNEEFLKFIKLKAFW